VYGRVVVNRLFVGVEPARNCDVIGKTDCPAVPGVDSAVYVLPGKMDCEENALAPCGCEKVNKWIRKPATPTF